MVKVVLSEMADSTDPLELPGDPTVAYCLLKFQWLNKKKHTPEVAKQILAIATGGKYLAISDQTGSSTIERQRLIITNEGLKLLRVGGFLNALIGSVSNVLSIVAVLISLISLCVSIWSGTHHGEIVHVQLVR